MFNSGSNSRAPWREGDADPEESGQANYLAELRDEVRGALERLIDKDLSGEPDSGKGRKKTIQVGFFVYFYIIKQIN